MPTDARLARRLSRLRELSPFLLGHHDDEVLARMFEPLNLAGMDDEAFAALGRKVASEEPRPMTVAQRRRLRRREITS